MERETRFELATPALARRCSTAELFPHVTTETILQHRFRFVKHFLKFICFLIRYHCVVPDCSIIIAKERRLVNTNFKKFTNFFQRYRLSEIPIFSLSKKTGISSFTPIYKLRQTYTRTRRPMPIRGLIP